MARQSKDQQEIVGRVMHEFKEGKLETSRGKRVRSPRQAIAIALHEAGASKYESPRENRENLQRTKVRQRRGGASGERSKAWRSVIDSSIGPVAADQ